MYIKAELLILPTPFTHLSFLFIHDYVEFFFQVNCLIHVVKAGEFKSRSNARAFLLVMPIAYCLRCVWQVRNSKDGSEVDDWGTMYNKAPAEITPQGNEMIFKKKRVKESLDSTVVAHQSVNGRRIRCIKESLTV
ncbi:hypothetical protein EV1_000114 [Malus domestica]